MITRIWLITSLCMAAVLGGCGTSKWSLPDGVADGVVPYSGVQVKEKNGATWGVIGEAPLTWQQLEFDDEGRPWVDTASPIAAALIHIDVKSGKITYSSTSDVDMTGAEVVNDPATGITTIKLAEFSAKKSILLDSIAGQIREITAQVESGNLTQREGNAAIGAVAQAAIAALGKSFVPAAP